MSLPDQVDVLVVGFGAAGAAAAIAAHDAGARVAVVEKTSAGGGNCRYSRGFLFEVDGARATLATLTPPLYAIPFQAGVATASRGPRRDARARVIDWHGHPVAGLYAAGAAGSVWAHLTEHGGGLTDAMVFGRVAGAQAAAAS